MNISSVDIAYYSKVTPLMNTAQHQDFTAQEIPDALDKRRAEALLRKLTASQMSELAWIGRPEWALKQIKLGQVQFEVVPHRYLNMISNELGYHWNGVDYV